MAERKTNAEIVGDGGLMPAWVSDHKAEQRRAGASMTYAYKQGMLDRDAAWLRFISDFRMGLNALVSHKDLAESPNQPGRTATLAWLDRTMREFGYTWGDGKWVRRAE